MTFVHITQSERASSPILEVNVVGEDPADRDAFFAECVCRWITFTAIGVACAS